MEFAIRQIVVVALVLLVLGGATFMLFKPNIINFIKNLPDYASKGDDVVINVNDLKILGFCAYPFGMIKNDGGDMVVYLINGDGKGTIQKTDLMVFGDYASSAGARLVLTRWKNKDFGVIINKNIQVNSEWLSKSDSVVSILDSNKMIFGHVGLLQNSYVINNILCTRGDNALLNDDIKK